MPFQRIKYIKKNYLHNSLLFVGETGPVVHLYYQIEPMKMKEEITTARLFRFCAGETTADENDRIAAWLDENPEEHQRRLNDVHSMYLVSILCESEATQPARRSARLTSFRRYAAGIAAALLVGFAGNYAFFAHRLNGWAEQQTVIEAPAGQHVRISLNDGSEVDLNSGSRLIYPAIFSSKERRVKLVGEARFDVSHNEKQPFVVETFAYDVQVLGTDFNVIADEAKGQFSTALFEGRVSIHNHRNSERIVMEPNTVVRLENGYLYVDKLESRDEYLWTEGILSFRNDSFDEIVEKLRKYYNVEIEIRCAALPKVTYGRLKIRISEGIEHALRILQLASDFTYEYDHDRNRIIIQ